MKKKTLNFILLAFLLLVFSCDEPETTVTNIIHPDGSITRRIEMRNKKNNFKPADLQVPFDSTWTTKDSLSIDDKKDTTWFKTGEKFFKNVEEINMSYLADKGINNKSQRKAEFTKKFRWFNTIYRFSEKVEKSLLYGYPIENFLSKEEMDFFYLPGNISLQKLSGPDSTRYKILNDTIEKRAERYLWYCVSSEWIEEFSKLTNDRAGKELSRESLKARENEIVDLIIKKKAESEKEVVSLILGEEIYKTFKKECDTASAIMERRLDIAISFKEYSVKNVMPGKVIGTNGFLENGNGILWPVKSDFMLAQQYEMWAESKVTNIWAWVITGIFILFVLAGLIIRVFRKK
jgi:hypothetical protein